MAKSESLQAQNYFARSNRIWFPDFEGVVQDEKRRYGKNVNNFSSLISVLRFFQQNLSRSQFVSQFLEQVAPQKMLSKDRQFYNRTRELCISYQNRTISNSEFDEQILLSFRNRPTEDVYTPTYESWTETTLLLSRLKRKEESLPHYFDGLGWNAYLKGIVTSRQYAERHLAWDTGGYLAQLLSYGVDKANLKEKYSAEISVCIRLRKLCIDYKDALLSKNDFDEQFLGLAREFCSDISE